MCFKALKMKKYGIYAGIGGITLFFFLLIACRSSMLEYLSSNKAARMPRSEREMTAEMIAESYDYRHNGLSFSYTFLEFGSTGCSACRQMERVMETIRTQLPNRVKVVFVDVARKENQNLADYYGIATIPTQVILDQSGQECYRHNGFISAEELTKSIFTQLCE